MGSFKYLRRREVEDKTGNKCSTLYAAIGRGIFPPGVRIGPKTVAWPDYEVDAINRARLNGKNEDDIRRLVTELIAARPSA